MQFEIKKQFEQGKALTGYSEDRIVLSGNHFGVLDGSRGPDYPGEDLITEILDDAAEWLRAMPADLSLAEVVSHLITMVESAKNEANIMDMEDMRRTGGFVFCLYSAHFDEVWRVGDCQYRMNGYGVEASFRAEEITAEARAMVIQSKLALGMSEDDIMLEEGYDDICRDLIRFQADLLNRSDPLSIGAINGTTVPPELLEIHKAQAGRLVISSDGYPDIRDTLTVTEARLSRLLETDPLCIGENLQCKGFGPNRSSFDDRAIIVADLGA